MIVFLGLLSIFYFFKPLHLKQEHFTDIPLFEIKVFEMYELNTQGLQTDMIGSKAMRFSDHYEVVDIDYTDNSKEFAPNIKANFGVYRDNTIDLDGNVVYSREDNLTFKSQHVIYNKNTGIAISDNDYIMYKGFNKTTGTYIKYNNKKNRVYSKNVQTIYQLQEEKQ